MGNNSPLSPKPETPDPSNSDYDGRADSNLSTQAIHSSPAKTLVLAELNRVLQSKLFRASKRSSQFLDFVVRYQLDNPSEPLKERAIGTALYGRPADYATGDDSVVRVQAREVRRKLERYYQASPDISLIRIDLPLGSYVPEFLWAKPLSTPESALAVTHAEEVAANPKNQPPHRPRFRGRYRLFGVAAATICIIAAVVAARIYLSPNPHSAIRQFWAPAYASQKALLICLAKPVLYRPSPQIYQKSAKYPGEFDHMVDRMNNPPNLKPNDVIRWGDMQRYYEFGVAEGDVEAAVSISDFLVRRNKTNEVRIGNGYNLEDIRNSPSVIIGAFSNPIAMQLTAGLHFSFVDDSNGTRIQEAGPKGRSWSPRDGPTSEDYGLVTRLVNSDTGQFTVLVAGLEASGSSAAAELVTDPGKLAQALRHAPKDWPEKNVQILVRTSVTNYVNSPPKIIAVYVW